MRGAREVMRERGCEGCACRREGARGVCVCVWVCVRERGV